MVSVSGVVLDGEDRILLQRHRYWVHDVWGLPGSIVQSGEKFEDAFAREVFEETGLFVSKIELVRVISAYRMRLDVYFKSRLDPEKGMQAINIQEQEILKARFFPLDDLPEKMLPAQREIVRIV